MTRSQLQRRFARWSFRPLSVPKSCRSRSLLNSPAALSEDKKARFRGLKLPPASCGEGKDDAADLGTIRQTSIVSEEIDAGRIEAITAGGGKIRAGVLPDPD